MNANTETISATSLFSQARARIDEVLALISEYDEIIDALQSMGFGGPPDHSDPELILPRLELTAITLGCYNVTNSDILDGLWENGPYKAQIRQRRMPLTQERSRLGDESGWKCFYCTFPGDHETGPDGRVWHVDHACPFSLGGDEMRDNLVLACATCNLDKKARSAMEYFRLKAERDGLVRA